MKIRTLFTSFVLALALGPVAFAQGGPGGPGGGANQAPKTDLEKQMSKISDANNALAPGRGGSADLSDTAKRADALVQAGVIKAAANEALKLAPKYTPPAITSEADKAKYLSDYQATMKKFIAAVDAFEAGLKANKSTEELTALRDAFLAIQRTEGHATFRAPRGGRGGPGGGGGPGGAPGGGMPQGGMPARGN
jgi:soluble cytochrome b562